MEFRDRITELRRVPASQLRRNPKNWRLHPEKQINALKGILSEVGFASAELARELPDGSLELIDGHARAEIAGDAMVPVLVLDVTEAEANKLLASFDPLAAMAETDNDMLQELLSSLSCTDASLMCALDDLSAEANRVAIKNVPALEYSTEFDSDEASNSACSATSKNTPTQIQFPLAIVIDRTTKERWDHLKGMWKITRDSDAFCRLMESQP